VGEIVGTAWQPVGAGNSVASFGLVGALLILTVNDRMAPLSFGVRFGLGWIIVFEGLALGGVRGAVIAGLLFGPLNALLMRINTRKNVTLLLAPAAIGLAIALALCTVRDIHGPPLIAGGIVGALVRRWK
jgi:hypothetical protein